MHKTRPQAPEFDARHFRNALSQFATGVTIITTRLPDGSFLGLTASSFNSVSMNPPLVLWSLAQTANSLPVFSGNSHYVINVLAPARPNWRSASRAAWITDSRASNTSFRAPACPF